VWRGKWPGLIDSRVIPAHSGPLFLNPKCDDTFPKGEKAATGLRLIRAMTAAVSATITAPQMIVASENHQTPVEVKIAG
jgi:hypothetical protein